MSAQQAKKSTSQTAAQSAARLASETTKSAAQTAYSAAESTRKQAQNVVNISTNAVREMIANGTGEAQKAQEKVFEIGREGVQNLARGADVATRIMVEAAGVSRDNMEACIECGNLTTNLARDLSTEVAEACNRTFSDCVDISKEAFNCRTINDVMELQNRAIRQVLDNFFTDSNRICNLLFEYATECVEPINQCATNASEKLGKSFAS